MGSTTPPYDQWDLKEWLADLVMRFAFIDKVITWGIEKTSTYWLGAFFNPQSLLSIFHQVSDSYIMIDAHTVCIVIELLISLFLFRAMPCHI